MKKLALMLAALMLCTVFVPLSVFAADETEYVLPVFETADLHGYLVDTGFEVNENYQYRFARIADIVEDRRGGSDANALLLDGGDIYSGNAIESQQDGKPVSAAYAAMRYDAVALGGHEFDVGLENAVDPDGTMPDYALSGLSGVNSVPVLCCNLYRKSDGTHVTRTKDYVILEKTAVAANGAKRTVRVAVIGYLHNMSGSILPEKIADYSVDDSLVPIDALARSLKQKDHADAVVLLAHRDAKTTAAALPIGTAVDLVCGADSHYAQYGTENTEYIQPSSKARGYASAELRFTDNGVSVAAKRTVSVTVYPSLLHDTAGNANNLNTSVMTVSRLALDGIRNLLDTKLGTITTAITSDPIAGSPMSSTGGNWMTDLANRACGTQVSFTNSGGIATQLLLANGVHTVTKADIYNLAPYSNRLYVYTLRYRELLGILNWAVSHTSLNLRISGIDCYYSEAGVTALVENGICIYKDGRWATDYQNRYVQVSANEYVATSPYGPFAGYAATDRSRIDNESFIAMLEAEGDATGGHLSVDTTPHFLKSTYSGDLAQIPFTDVKEGAYYYDAVLWAVNVEPQVTAGTSATTFSPNAMCTRAQVVTFLWRASGRPEPTKTDNPFKDVKEDANYYKAVLWAVENGVTAGTGATTFSPNQGCTRAQVVTFLWRAHGQPEPTYSNNPFKDVTGGYYYTAVLWAVENKITAGTSATAFSPNQTCTRGQIVTFLYRVFD